ncbi:MAG TPA: hypothetical protein VFO19_23320 [Vicinamibacterales bacterium]|nr:hypothetical protein [Vicinamibacterales bacterium]
MIYELPARRVEDDKSDTVTAHRLSELLAACLGGPQANEWAVKIIARPACRILPFTTRAHRAAHVVLSAPIEDESAS